MITQDDVFPAARGVVWDLRKHSDVAGQPLDTTTDFFSYFNLDFLRSELADYPDNCLLSQLTTGVDFQIDPGLTFVLFPHLASLAEGFGGVDDEVNKFIKQGLFEVHNLLPFFPTRCQGRGAVARKLEDRFRHTTDAGQPRSPIFGTDGLASISRRSTRSFARA